MEAGEIIETEEFETLSDGTAGGVEAGAITLPICQQVIDRSLLVSESEIRSAMRIIAQSEQWMVEGAAGVALAAFLKESVRYEGRKVAVVLCGRNIALDRFLQAVA
jgi:threonine dehydratase